MYLKQALIDESNVHLLEENGTDSVVVRSPVTCETKYEESVSNAMAEI